MQLDWLNSTLSPVVHGDIVLSINTQYIHHYFLIDKAKYDKNNGGFSIYIDVCIPRQYVVRLFGVKHTINEQTKRCLNKWR